MARRIADKLLRGPMNTGGPGGKGHTAQKGPPQKRAQTRSFNTGKR